MTLLLAVYLIVPSLRYSPNLHLSWFAFDWYMGIGWILYVPSMFQGVYPFIFIGLGTIIPFLLLILIFLDRKAGSYSHALLCFILASVLAVVHLYGIYLIWPIPFQPIQSVSIILFTFLAYMNWSSIRRGRSHERSN